MLKQRLRDLGKVLPAPPQPVGDYSAALISSDQLYLSGQLPLLDGELIYSGRLGRQLSVAQGRDAAELCALNLLSQLNQALADQYLLVKVLKLEGFINASPDFTEHAAVLDGASQLIAEVLQTRAGHVRTVLGCTSLPGNAAVEIAMIAQVTKSENAL